MFLHNCWYMAAWAEELQHGVPLAKRLLDVPLVFWRASEGRIVAQEDRCPHRMAPLSLGRIERDAIRCLYHGAKFDLEGRCIEVPGQEQMPANLKVRTFPLIERAGMLWVWMGTEAPGEEPPDVAEMFGAEWAGKLSYMHYDAPYELILDNLLDLSHVAFVHEGTLASSTAAAAIRPRIERFPWGLRTSHVHPDEPLPPYLRDVAQFEGLVDRWYVSTCFAKSRMVTFQGGSAPAGTGAIDGHYDHRALLNRALHVLTPETENSSHYFYSFRRGFALESETLTDLLAERFEDAFLQDKRMIEAQARNIDPMRHMLVIQADIAPLYVRKLTETFIREEQAGKSAVP
jgi:phenylpropionate dioxygenase-like ring-hydroxylating dioxygenase large terminal subunit